MKMTVEQTREIFKLDFEIVAAMVSEATSMEQLKKSIDGLFPGGGESTTQRLIFAISYADRLRPLIEANPLLTGKKM